MAILDRPMFQRRLTKDELRGYGIPAFANGGVVQKFANGGGTRSDLYKKKPKQEEATTAITDLIKRDPKGRLIESETAITDFVRPTGPATGMTIPSSVYEEETVTDTLQDGPDIQLKEKPTPPKNLEGETKMTDERLLLERAKKKSDLYNEYLRKYGEDDFRTQSFLQLAQFGSNLMSQGGSNFLDKVAKSAQDPLKAFAEIAAKNTQAQKEIDVLALQKAETEIALEKEQEFELAKEAIKNSKAADPTKVEQYADLLQATFPEKYPNTKEGRQSAIDQGFKFVEFSPEQTPATILKDQMNEMYNADKYRYQKKDEASGETVIDYDLLEKDARDFLAGAGTTQPVIGGAASVANQGEEVISDFDEIKNILEK